MRDTIEKLAAVAGASLGLFLVSRSFGVPPTLTIPVMVIAGAGMVGRTFGRGPLAAAERRRRVSDLSFRSFFTLYVIGAIAWLAAGLLPSITAASAPLHRWMHDVGGAPREPAAIGVDGADLFDRFSLTQPAGEPIEVRFSNTPFDPDEHAEDSGPQMHNFSVYDRPALNPIVVGRVIPPGGSDVIRFAVAPGRYLYRCDLHPTTMVGTLEVLADAEPEGPSWLSGVARRVAAASHGSASLQQQFADDADESGPAVARSYLFSLLNIAVAVFLIRARGKDRVARLFAVGMIGTAAVFNFQAHYGLEVVPWMRANLHDVFHTLSGAAYMIALLLFPDGHLAPRWSELPRWRWPLRALGLYVVLMAGAIFSGTHDPSGFVAFYGVVVPVAGIVSQRFRMRHARTEDERQQSRVFMWTLAIALGAVMVIAAITALLTGLGGDAFDGRRVFDLFSALFALIPIALVFVLVRYRVWDMERIVSKALLYAALAGGIGVVYVAGVAGIGRAIGDEDNLALSIAATVLVAVAFEPVRERLERVADRLVYGPRATPYEVMSEFSQRLAGAGSADEVLESVAEGVGRAVGAVWGRAAVRLPTGDEVARTWRSGDTEPDEELVRAIPVTRAGETIGSVGVAKAAGDPFTHADERLLRALVAQASVPMRNVRLAADLRAQLETLSSQANDLTESRQRLLAARNAEQRRLERDIRETVETKLLAIASTLGEAEAVLAAQPEAAAERLEAVGKRAGEALETLRDLARGIFPPLLADKGLVPALETLARKAAVQIRVEASEELRLTRFDPHLEAAAYFCCAELLARLREDDAGAVATTVTVGLALVGDELVCEVHDPAARLARAEAGTEGTMVDRVQALGGELRFDLAGTSMRVALPARALAGEPS